MVSDCGHNKTDRKKLNSSSTGNRVRCIVTHHGLKHFAISYGCLQQQKTFLVKLADSSTNLSIHHQRKLNQQRLCFVPQMGGYAFCLQIPKQHRPKKAPNEHTVASNYNNQRRRKDASRSSTNQDTKHLPVQRSNPNTMQAHRGKNPYNKLLLCGEKPYILAIRTA